MQRINFFQDPLSVETTTHPKLETEWLIKLNQIQMAKIISAAKEEFSKENGSGELMLELTRQNTLYIKKRDSGVRLMLSHPEKEEWVGVISFDSSALSKLEQEISQKMEVTTSRLSTLSGINNLEVRWLVQ